MVNKMNSTIKLSVQDTIRFAKISSLHIKILFLCLSILILDGFDTALIGYIAPAIVDSWGISKTDLGIAMSSALVGLSVGAVTSGPISDKLGRKPVIVISVFMFGICSIATIFSTTVYQLSFWRLLTGIGIGAAMSNALTLISEYAPENRKSLMVNSVFCGFPFGAAMGGILGSFMIPKFGWESMLVIGGIIPILLVVPLIFILPESVLFLINKNKSEDKIKRICKKIVGENYNKIDFSRLKFIEKQKIKPINEILSHGHLSSTLLLWNAYFMGLLIFYVVTNWMPILIKDSGFELSYATILTALFPLGGGVGTIISGIIMDKLSPHKIVSFNYLITGILLFSIGYVDNIISLGILILLAGTTMNSAQASMGTIATLHYPTTSRATGVSWMLGIGRAGGILGAMFGAWLVQLGLGYRGVLMTLFIPSAIASISLLSLLMVLNNKKIKTFSS
ncbi:aromatic acid/H+ symport family MFS transporter [Photorhabdus laumondii subsp. clarkei]|uniref:Aromatic acid/H+ symport family MFS transporter n=2 Tax=Photorhabdus TaxID=29487 RepID=A0A329VJ70_9GAMM|nr:aromatic acid/H+ symport family MFS transporter [Photorhabdus laumondii subsp. clarkei]